MSVKSCDTWNIWFEAWLFYLNTITLISHAFQSWCCEAICLLQSTELCYFPDWALNQQTLQLQCILLQGFDLYSRARGRTRCVAQTEQTQQCRVVLMTRILTELIEFTGTQEQFDIWATTFFTKPKNLNFQASEQPNGVLWDSLITHRQDLLEAAS